VNATQHQDFRPFEVLVSSGREGVCVAPAGEVDLATAGQLQERIDALLGDRTRLALDLGDVTFMDSTGVRLVLELVHAARRDDWELVVIRVPHAVRRVFELSGVLDVVPLGEAGAA